MRFCEAPQCTYWDQISTEIRWVDGGGGARSSSSEWLGIWWGDLSKIGNRRRITAGKQAGEQSNLEAGLSFELCGREATVYVQSCWLKTLRIGWRVESGRFQIWIYWLSTLGSNLRLPSCIWESPFMLHACWPTFRTITFKFMFSDSQYPNAVYCTSFWFKWTPKFLAYAREKLRMEMAL